MLPRVKKMLNSSQVVLADLHFSKGMKNVKLALILKQDQEATGEF